MIFLCFKSLACFTFLFVCCLIGGLTFLLENMTLHVVLIRYSKCKPQQLSRRQEHTASRTQSRTPAHIFPAEKLITFAFNFLKDSSMQCGILVFIDLLCMNLFVKSIFKWQSCKDLKIYFSFEYLVDCFVDLLTLVVVHSLRHWSKKYL